MVLLAALVLLALAQPAYEQASKSAASPPTQTQRTQQPGKETKASGETTLRGCGGPEGILTWDGFFHLTGDTSVLRHYANKYMAIRVRNVARRGLNFTAEFVRFEKVLPQPVAKLNPLMGDPSRWRVHKNKKYGVKFAVPDSFPAVTFSGVFERPYFVNQQGSVVLASFSVGVPFSRSNFAGGFFSIFVNPEISNEPSCLQFRTPYPRRLSWRTADGVRYREFDDFGAAGGTWHGFYTFHTFQNGFCYAVAVEMAEVNIGSFDQGCITPVVTQQRRHDLTQLLLSRVVFFRPRIALPQRETPSSVPAVTSFTASSLVANAATNRGVITFSWSTRSADYVQLSYRCKDNRIVILEQSKARQCENAKSPLPSESAYQAIPVNRSPRGSVSVGFGNRRDEPVPVQVVITPFSHAKAFPAASKTIAITVSRYNPFPEGIPTKTTNVTVLSPVKTGRALIYKQGSRLTIRWTDSLKSDRCVNLYLVQDKGGTAPTYVTQIGGCVFPAKRGSFTWTIPHKYSGSGFRILLYPVATTSHALTAPFRIVP